MPDTTKWWIKLLEITHLLQLGQDVSGVVEWTDVVVMAAIHESHGLQALAASLHLRRQQERVVQVIEELAPVRERGRRHSRD